MGLSRGDGKEGEDITNNLMTIDDIPKNISAENFPDEIDIRGEVFIQNNDFENLKSFMIFNVFSLLIIFLEELLSYPNDESFISTSLEDLSL